MSNFPAVQGVGADLQAALQQSQVNETQSGGIQHIKYDSYSGAWIYGKDNIEITDEVVLINTASIVHGWHLWCDKEVETRMVPFTRALPEAMDAKRDKKNKLQEPSEARGFQCMILEENGDAVAASWEHSTFGCRQAIDTVLIEIKARSMSEAEFLYPKVQLTSGEPYENPYKENEMIHPPVLEIVAWCNQNGEEQNKAATLPKEDDAEEVADEEPQPKRRRTRAS